MYTSFAVDDCEMIPLTPPPCFVSIMQSPHDFLEGLELDRRRSSVGGKDKVDFPHLPREEEGGPLHRFLRQRRASNFPPVCQPHEGSLSCLAKGGRRRSVAEGRHLVCKKMPSLPLDALPTSTRKQKEQKWYKCVRGKIVALEAELVTLTGSWFGRERKRI